MKWTWMVLGAVAAFALVAFVGLRVYFVMVTNPRVVEALHGNPEGEQAARVMVLTFPDGRQLPVNYLQEGNQVFAGADGRWWRAFREGEVPVQVYIRGRQLSGRARTVMDDADYTRDVFERLRPNVPDWLPQWLNAYLVVIDLEPPT